MQTSGPEPQCTVVYIGLGSKNAMVDDSLHAKCYSTRTQTFPHARTYRDRERESLCMGAQIVPSVSALSEPHSAATKSDLFKAKRFRGAASIGKWAFLDWRWSDPLTPGSSLSLGHSDNKVHYRAEDRGFLQETLTENIYCCHKCTKALFPADISPISTWTFALSVSPNQLSSPKVGDISKSLQKFHKKAPQWIQEILMTEKSKECWFMLKWKSDSRVLQLCMCVLSRGAFVFRSEKALLNPRGVLHGFLWAETCDVGCSALGENSTQESNLPYA